MKYKNPILKGFYPDPSICLVGDQFYLVNSTFEYFPSIPVFTSNDLLNWEQLPSVIDDEQAANLFESKSSEGFFAATIREHEGTFYVITTNITTFKTLLMHTKNPRKGWSKPIEISINGIDPSLFFEGGRVYVQYTGYIAEQTKAIQQVEIDLQTGGILTGPSTLTFGSGGRDVEGPHLYKKAGFYYLITAEGGTREGHMICLFKSNNLWGPYESCPRNPILSNRDYPREPLQAIGHGELFQDVNHQWWLVCLGTRPIKHQTTMGRETLLYPVRWQNEWPVVYNEIATVEVDLAEFPEHQRLLADTTQKVHRTTAFIDKMGKLNPEMLTLRKSICDRLVQEQNCIRLKGKDTKLTDFFPTFLAFRQTEHNNQFSVTFSLLEAGSCCGITAFIDSQHHSELLLEKRGAKILIYRRTHIRDFQLKELISETTGDSVALMIQCSEETYRFYYGENPNFAYQLDSAFLTTEFSYGKNTGVMCGVFAEGKGEVKVNHFIRRDS